MNRSMGDSHRRFLQTMMSNGIIDNIQARALHQHCCEVHSGHYIPDKLDEFIDVINAQLQPMFMNIRKAMSEEDGLQYYALVNLTETDITRMSSDYADNELELFRKAMDLIVDSENGTASSTDILNCADTLQTKKLRKKEAELVLNKFVQDKWLNEKHGEYTLSTRCITEMDQYIRTMYRDLVKICHVCHNIALQSQMCENPGCGIKMHLPCVARYFKGRSDPHCPACSDFWPHEIPEFHRRQSQASQSQFSSAKENTAPAPSTSSSRRSRR
ncbi:non-structural maintenance of chromosomes element 1 homolog [Chanos chanos]|uniref:Non-structural maintenance of chromosomes element 1 homolog n=1 Tax=Chanos chanos TaxID=29144 RepID=A0A6J2WPH2_CHACN|nr:non-structural maintenance of chromosomes element 1 homolog [Chanos chanos]XP_030646585.1 non-structural maintenance of chromosomes element 1 homolog [Chanos chanos]